MQEKPQPKYQDLLYFGYDYGNKAAESKQLEQQFIKEIHERFPPETSGLQMRDTYDQIKGYRQEVYLYESENDNYYSWLIGKQWFYQSMTAQLLSMGCDNHPEQHKKLERYFALAKQQYPEAFKPEALNQ